MIKLKVKCFDYEHEKDLEKAINKFIQDHEFKSLEIHYSTSHFYDNDSQIFSFSALILYDMSDDE